MTHRYFPQHAGPTDFSNWVIPRHLMVGEYPGSKNRSQHAALAAKIVAAGVDTVVCLQPARETRKLPQYKQVRTPHARRCARGWMTCAAVHRRFWRPLPSSTLTKATWTTSNSCGLPS